MGKTPNSKSLYDLEERMLAFAKQVRSFVRTLPKSILYQEDAKQLIRSSVAAGANYIEANDALGKKDFAMRMRISRKEAKESAYWLRTLDALSPAQEQERSELVQEATELVKITSAIINKT